MQTAWFPDEPLIAPGAAAARTLPARWYTDPDILRLEMEKVFRRTWQLAGRADQVASPGDFVTVEVAGEPVVVVRDEESRLRAFSNVCRHRAGPVACGAGRRRALSCGYHGWTYRLDGTLCAAPGFDGAEGFDPAAIRLPEARVSAWGPLLFVNLDAMSGDCAPSGIDEMLREITARAATSFDPMRPAGRRDYTVGCNWKVYVDNYLEGYHIPVVHPDLFRRLDHDAYRTETFEAGSVQIAPMRGRDDQALYFWIFPNLMLNVYPDNFSTNLILPVGHDRTLTIFEWFFRDPDSAARRARIDSTIAVSDAIQKEDIAVCEAVQRGLSSSAYDRGRYAPGHESGVHHFHRLLERAVRNKEAP